MSDLITPKDLAIMCDTDAKTMRRFMRSLTDGRVGKGGRWAIEASDVDAIVSAFANRASARAQTFDASRIKGK